MDISKLSMLLNKAKVSGITFGEIPKDISPLEKDAFLAHKITIEKSIDEELTKTIKDTPELSIFDGKMFCCGFTAQRVELEQLKKWLLYDTHRYGVEKTIKNLAEYIKIDGNPVCEVQLVSGVEVEQESELADNITLVPFDKIPDCWQKKHLSPSSYNFPDNKYCSKSAILRRIRVSPKSFHQDEHRGIPLKADISLSEICEVLTLVGPSAPYPSAYWTILEETIPIKIVTGISGGMNALNYHVYKYNPEDYTFAKDIIKNYLSLNENPKNSVLLAIQRLNMAQRRDRMEDKAIDLGIAFEILLLNDYKEHDPISFPFRLRGAWILEDEPNKRKHVLDLLKAIYDCRCSAVHGGKLKKNKYTINGKEMQLPKIYEEGFNLCATLIVKIVKKNEFPDWNTLLLGL